MLDVEGERVSLSRREINESEDEEMVDVDGETGVLYPHQHYLETQHVYEAQQLDYCNVLLDETGTSLNREMYPSNIRSRHLVSNPYPEMDGRPPDTAINLSYQHLKSSSLEQGRGRGFLIAEILKPEFGSCRSRTGLQTLNPGRDRMSPSEIIRNDDFRQQSCKNSPVSPLYKTAGLQTLLPQNSPPPNGRCTAFVSHPNFCPSRPTSFEAESNMRSQTIQDNPCHTQMCPNPTIISKLEDTLTKFSARSSVVEANVSTSVIGQDRQSFDESTSGSSCSEGSPFPRRSEVEERQHPVSERNRKSSHVPAEVPLPDQLPAWVYCTRYSDRPSSGKPSHLKKFQFIPVLDNEISVDPCNLYCVLCKLYVGNFV